MGTRLGLCLALLLVLLSYLMPKNVVFADNPTSIVPAYAGPDPGYIIAESTTGLANRLRVLAAYMYIAEFKYNGGHLVFIWDKNEACPGHFLSVFEPIENVIFATNMSRYVLDKHSKINYEDSNAVFGWIMRMNQIPKNRFGLPSWNEIEYKMYSKYYPTREIMYKALSYIEKYNVCNSSAMHIRETDLAVHISKQSNGRKKLSRDGFIQFVESRPPEESIFLLTDNPDTQTFFINKYGNKKILTYESMTAPINKLPLYITNITSITDFNTNTTSSSINKAEDHRYTTLENTVIDVIIAAHAKTFKGTPFSSLTELVHMFSNIGKNDRGWCK
jgi:hypothetical protein